MGIVDQAQWWNQAEALYMLDSWSGTEPRYCTWKSKVEWNRAEALHMAEKVRVEFGRGFVRGRIR